MNLKKKFNKFKQNDFVKMGATGAGLAGLTALSGGTLPVIAGVGLAGAGLYQQYKNYQNQQKQQEYERGLQNKIFEREDTSTSRRVEDLRSAGLNPVLAAGDGAGAGAVVNTKPPQMDNPLDAITGVLALLKMKEDISNTVAQRDLIAQQVSKAQAEAGIKWHDFKIFKENPAWKDIPSSTGGLMGNITALLGGAFPDANGSFKGAMDELTDKIPTNWFGMPQVKWNPITNKMEPIGQTSQKKSKSNKPKGDKK